MNPLIFATAGFFLSIAALANSLCLYFVTVARERIYPQWEWFFFVLILLIWISPLIIRSKTNSFSPRDSLLFNTFSSFPLLLTSGITFCPPYFQYYLGVWGAALAACFCIRLLFFSPTLKAKAREIAASRWALHILIFAGALLYFSSPQARFLTVDEASEGIHLGTIHALSNGQWPVAEAGYGYGPLYYWMEYWITRVLGGTFFSMRLMFLVCNFAAFAFYYFFLCRAVSSSRLRFLGAVLLLCFTPLCFVATNPTLIYGTVNLTRFAVALAALGIFMVWIKRKTLPLLFLSGFFSAFSLFFSMEYGLAVIAACLFFLVCSSLKAPLRFFPRFGVYSAGGITLSLLVLIPFAVNGFSPLRLFHNLFEFMLGEGSSSLTRGFQLFPLNWDAGTPTPQRILAYLFSWKTQLLLPLFLYPLGYYGIVRLRRSGALSFPEAERLFVLCLFGNICYLIPYLNQSGYYYLFCSSPPLIVLALALWEKIRSQGLISRARLNIFSAGVLVWIAFSNSGVFQIAIDWMRARTHVLAAYMAFSVRMGHPRAGGIYIHEPQERFTLEMLRLLEEKTKPGEEVHITPCPGFYLFLSGRTNATRFFYHLEPAVRKAQLEEIAQELTRKKIRYVIETAKNPSAETLNRLLDEDYNKEAVMQDVTLYTVTLYTRKQHNEASIPASGELLPSEKKPSGMARPDACATAAE